MARLFYHHPTFAILDESTSALDPQNEDLMYTRFSEMGIACISTGHRESLMEYHKKMLVFDGKGGWELFKEEVFVEHIPKTKEKES